MNISDITLSENLLSDNTQQISSRFIENQKFEVLTNRIGLSELFLAMPNSLFRVLGTVVLFVSLIALAGYHYIKYASFKVLSRF
jgi:hypothetical protein